MKKKSTIEYNPIRVTAEEFHRIEKENLAARKEAIEYLNNLAREVQEKHAKSSSNKE